MATIATATIPKTGPAIRTALAEHSAPGEADRFVSELQDALIRACESLELDAAQTVLDRWHALATMALNPLSEAEQAQLARARAGDLTGLRARDEQGNWETL